MASKALALVGSVAVTLTLMVVGQGGFNGSSDAVARPLAQEQAADKNGAEPKPAETKNKNGSSLGVRRLVFRD